MLQLVADEGYDSITVRKLAGLAGVSTASFYARFDGKEECFLTSFTLVLDRIRGHVRSARSHHHDRRTQLTRTVEALLAEPTADPETARVALVDAFSGGPAALKRLREFEMGLEAEVKSSLSRRGAATSALVTNWITTGWFRVCRNVLTQEIDEAEELAAHLTSWGMSHLENGLIAIRPKESTEHHIMDCDALSGHGRFEEREAILSATTKLAMSDGYWRLNVSDIRKRAGVSRAAFAAHFDGVDDCYLAAVAQLTHSYLSTLVVPAASMGAWVQGVHRAVATLTRRLAAEPEKGRFAFLGILEPGTAGLKLRERLIGELACTWERAVTPVERQSSLAAEATLGAFWGVIAQHLDANGGKSLPAEAQTLTFLLLAPSLRLPIDTGGPAPPQPWLDESDRQIRNTAHQMVDA